MARIKIASAKDRGRRLQKWVAMKISNLLGLPYGKDELIAPREMGQAGTDIRLIGKARELFPFSCECKYQEKWAIPAWIDQARENQLPDTDWLLVVKRNRHDPVVIMDAEAFFCLLNKLRSNQRE